MASHDHKLMPVRCDAEDPHRCAYSGDRGQCSFLAVPDSQFCPMHSAVSDISKTRTSLYKFKRDQIAKNIERIRDHEDSHSLSVELALTRTLLEEVINSCGDEYALITNEATISRLLGNVRETLKDNQKLEERYGDLLSLDQVTTLMQHVFDILSRYVSDPHTLNVISDEFSALLENRVYLHPEEILC